MADRQVAQDLAAFVRVLAHEMSPEQFTTVESEIFREILGLMHSPEMKKRLAGVAALHALIGVSSADEEKKATKFATNLSHGLRASHINYEFLSAVTKALGLMALGAAHVDYVEVEVTRALEWVQVQRSDRRLAAVLTLKELAQNAPAAFYSRTKREDHNAFIDHIFPVLRDLHPIVRVCAADAFVECLKIIVDPARKREPLTTILCQIYEGVLVGFKAGKLSKSSTPLKKGFSGNFVIESEAQITASQHASLLIVGDLMEHIGDFMLPRYNEVCGHVLALRDHPKALLRLEVVRLIVSCFRPKDCAVP
jgi:FKBP12-rapamycin complex-associated protein